MNLTRSNIEKFRKQVKQAKINEEDSFIFGGIEVAVVYAEHAIELIDGPEMADVDFEIPINLTKGMASIIEFCADMDMDEEDCKEMFMAIALKLRDMMNDERKAEFDESSDELKQGFALSAILDGVVGIGSVEVEKRPADEPLH